ncbi:MAG: caspase family protein, partial [Bacteroidota bacterium]
VENPLLNPDKASLEAYIRDYIPQKVKEEKNDRVVIYFAGHGEADINEEGSPQGYLLPSDALSGNTSSSVPMSLLHSVVEALPCQHLLLILDCCFAGAFQWDVKKRGYSKSQMGNRLFRAYFARNAEKKARQVIVSTGDDQKAVDILDRRLDRNSPFAAGLIKGLQGLADNPKNGFISISKLVGYVDTSLEVTLSGNGEVIRQKAFAYTLNNHEHGEFFFCSPYTKISLWDDDYRINPFKGWAAYEEADAYRFYGRDEDMEQLLDTLEQHKYTFLHGSTYTGKKSVVTAGLLPELKSRNLSVCRLIVGQIDQVEFVKQIERYHRVIVICPSDVHLQVARENIKTVLEATAKRSDIHVLCCADTHLYEQLPIGDWAKFGPIESLKLKSLTRLSLRDMIENPLVFRGFGFEPAKLPEIILEELRPTLAPLPLLSATMHATFQDFIAEGRPTRMITLQNFQRTGGVQGVFIKQFKTALEQLDSDARQWVMLLLSRFIQQSDHLVLSRDVQLQELEYEDPTITTHILALLDHLHKAGVLFRKRNTYQFAYPLPISSWPPLQTWLLSIGQDKIDLQRELWLATTKYERSKQNEVRIVGKENSETAEGLWGSHLELAKALT